MNLFSIGINRTASFVGVVGLSAIALLGSVKPVEAAILGTFDVNASVKTKVFNKIGNTTGTFNTEMLELDLDPIQINGVGSVTIRENPNIVSTGQTTINDIGGGNYQIYSFFDIFTQISLDNGLTWIDSEGSTRVELASSPNPTSFGVITTNPNLPPDQGGYFAPFHSLFKLLGFKDPVRMAQIFHFRFRNIVRTPIAPGVDGVFKDEIEMFNSTVQGQIELVHVPEPTTILGSTVALGFGTFFRKKYSRQSKKQAVS